MILNISQLIAEPGAAEAFDFQLTPEMAETDCVLLTPLAAVGRLTNDGNGLRLTGRITAGARLACSRCLAPVEREVTADAAEDYGFEEFSGESPSLDLGEIATQLWITALPMRVLCRPDCLGLCPSCGRDLNQGPCACPKDEGDPRLAALKNFFGSVPDGRR